MPEPGSFSMSPYMCMAHFNFFHVGRLAREWFKALVAYAPTINCLVKCFTGEFITHADMLVEEVAAWILNRYVVCTK